MQHNDAGKVDSLWTYPIKGFTPISHDQAEVQAGKGLSGDRLFGFAKGNSGFDPLNPKPLPKDHFLVLMEHAKIAGLQTAFDPVTYQFQVNNDGQVLLDINLQTQDGQSKASKFFTEYLELNEAEAPFFANAEPHRFTDVSVVSDTFMNAVSILNLASVRDFEKQTSLVVDPMRFRANIIVDGLLPFQEFELINKTIKLGDVTFKVLMRTKRCAATEVNPTTAERDIKLPGLLRQTYGHFDMGVYAQIVSNGTIKVGSPISVQPD
ncbi:MAG: MOSC domain-containing protein [Rhizobiaceae bacterium]